MIDSEDFFNAGRYLMPGQRWLFNNKKDIICISEILKDVRKFKRITIVKDAYNRIAVGEVDIHDTLVMGQKIGNQTYYLWKYLKNQDSVQ